MCGIENCDRIGTHKEAGVTRVTRDERDVQKLVTTFNSGIIRDPFHIPDDSTVEEASLPLSSLATGVVLPDADSSRLLGSTESGRQNMETFISSRIESNEVNFWDPVKKLNIKTFSSVAKKITVKNQKEKIVSVNADRELFSRLLVSAKSREINLK